MSCRAAAQAVTAPAANAGPVPSTRSSRPPRGIVGVDRSPPNTASCSSCSSSTSDRSSGSSTSGSGSSTGGGYALGADEARWLRQTLDDLTRSAAEQAVAKRAKAADALEAAACAAVAAAAVLDTERSAAAAAAAAESGRDAPWLRGQRGSSGRGSGSGAGVGGARPGPPAPAWAAVCEVLRWAVPARAKREHSDDVRDWHTDLRAEDWRRLPDSERSFLASLDPAAAASRALALSELLPGRPLAGLLLERPALLLGAEPGEVLQRLIASSALLALSPAEALELGAGCGEVLLGPGGARARLAALVGQLEAAFARELPAASRPAELARAVVGSNLEGWLDAWQRLAPPPDLAWRLALVRELGAQHPHVAALARGGFEPKEAAGMMGAWLLGPLDSLLAMKYSCLANQLPALYDYSSYSLSDWIRDERARRKLVEAAGEGA
ncbi:hypothetical protein HYH03_006505 [Edaphochlamys debaryana]|uniref:Uncharacterized protein n=1 Tax=Edaphochlamys debaryana TaxID=47281 RepID=A0A835Y6U5_9CHLO|nr:hypothetical protein HYH03_006505 [Edaphochlamys debaryana]|eukprot:KAG2495231.1 hypothetical protein HYH03_006505 [Edaphochlamys debaryana]